jgi:hypothetical protein
VSNKNKNMATQQSAVKEQVSKKIKKNKTKNKSRILKNIINKPRNDYPEFSGKETFVLADSEGVLLKLVKIDGNITIADSLNKNTQGVNIVNLFTGRDIWSDLDNADDIKLYQISKNGADLCRMTIGGGVVASIKKPDISVVLEAWVE